MNVPVSIEEKLRKFDKRLRIRWGSSRGCFIVEQKSGHKQLLDPKKFKDVDAYICARDGYYHIMDVAWSNLDKVLYFLKKAAIWRWQKRYEPGWKAVEKEYDRERDEAEAGRLYRQSNKFDALGSEAFSALAWREKRRVSMNIGNAVVNDHRRVFA